MVAPTTCTSPRESAGLSMFEASIAPVAAPAPTTVCNSSIKRMMRPRAARISSITAFKRSSNSPRNFDPATMLARSSESNLRSRNSSGTSPAAIRCAIPSATAVLPTPVSPTKTGLFLVRRQRIRITRVISESRPITGSRCPSRAKFVKSVLYLSRISYRLSASGSSAR